jgi:hypothetical protein
MPDFERFERSLEEHVAQHFGGEEAVQQVRRVHKAKDLGRIQGAVVALLFGWPVFSLVFLHTAGGG